jgi:acetyl-CoA synthetase
MFESVPTYPDPYRYWDLVQRHGVTKFYTAPTAIRALMRYSAEPIAAYDLSSLRVLGEPINTEAWRRRCTVSDTYWQTETGAHVAVKPARLHAHEARLVRAAHRRHRLR